MDENEVPIPEVPQNEPSISETELAEIEQSLANEPKPEINWRHPQQVLTNKEMQILLSKKEEEMTEVEKSAMKWMILRLKHHNSTPKKVNSTKQNTLRRKKRRMSNASRKANR